MDQSPGPSHFLSQLQRYQDDHRFADFTIRIEEREFNVNRQLLACHSGYFRALFNNSFRESRVSLIELKDDDPAMVEKMVTYFHTFDYNFKAAPGPFDKLLLEKHARMYLIADKYDVPDLKVLSVKKFGQSAAALSDRPLHMVPAIKFIWDHTTSSHKDIRSEAINAWVVAEHEVGAGEKSQSTIKSLAKVPEFAAELAVMYGTNYTVDEPRFCVECKCGTGIYADSIKYLQEAECGVCYQIGDFLPDTAEMTNGRLKFTFTLHRTRSWYQ